jgi:CheY-like chemotaxis protein
VSSAEGVGTTFYFEMLSQVVERPVSPRVEVITNTEKSNTDDCSLSSYGTILVVEDNQVNRKVVQAMLQKNGYIVQSAEHGKLALDAIREGLKPDVILMDCQMPIMDGFEATRAIRDWEASHHHLGIPIVALTAGAFAEDRERCMSAGMNDFLTKPIDVHTLLATIKKYTQSKSLTQQSKPVVVSLPTNNEKIVFDLNDLLGRCDNDEGLAREILEIFLLDYQSMTKMLSDAIRRGSAPDVRLYAHSVKGSAANVGARFVSELAKTIEIAGASGDLTDADKLCEQLITAINEFVIEAQAVRGEN